MSQTVAVRKLWGSFPESIRMRGELVEFNENGEAAVSQKVADFLSAELAHEYVVADASGNFVYPSSEGENEAPSRREVTDEERDMRGELARLRVEVQAMPEIIERLEQAEKAAMEANAENNRLTEENAALKTELEKVKAELVAATPAPAAPAAPATPAATPTRRAPAQPKQPE